MGIELHPEASRSFDAKGEDLLKLVTSDPPNHIHPKPFTPNYYRAAHLNLDNLIAPDSYIRQAQVTYAGEEVSAYVHRRGLWAGFEGEGYAQCRRLAEAIARRAELRELVTEQLLIDLIVEWAWIRNSQSSFVRMSEHVVSEIDALVQDQTIWLPIHGLVIQEDFPFGRVEFRTMTPELLDEWDHGEYGEQPPGPEQERRLKARRGRLQGHAAAVRFVRATPDKAIMVAREEAAAALGVLRLYSAASTDPDIRSNLTLLGGEASESHFHVVVKPGFPANFGEGNDARPFTWTIDSEQLRAIQSGAARAHALLIARSPTEFQQEVLSAIQLYSRSMLYASLADRLVYKLVALEAIFLRNASEPVMDNLAFRIAFLFDQSPNDRREVIRVIKSAYELRSKFLHHGRAITDLDDRETLRAFSKLMTMVMKALPRFTANNDTRLAFLDRLEHRRLGG